MFLLLPGPHPARSQLAARRQSGGRASRRSRSKPRTAADFHLRQTIFDLGLPFIFPQPHSGLLGGSELALVPRTWYAAFVQLLIRSRVR